MERMGDWLGTKRIANQNREFLSFEDARDFVRTLNLKSSEEWSEYSKSNRPKNIPSTPDRYYKIKWKVGGLVRKSDPWRDKVSQIYRRTGFCESTPSKKFHRMEEIFQHIKTT